MTAQKDGTFERMDPPQYVAFRKTSGGSTLAVIARLEARDMVGHHLGRWFSELTPDGVLRDVPVDADSYGIDESVAVDLINLIRNGQSLPRRIVRLLPEIPNKTAKRAIVTTFSKVVAASFFPGASRVGTSSMQRRRLSGLCAFAPMACPPFLCLSRRRRGPTPPASAAFRVHLQTFALLLAHVG